MDNPEATAIFRLMTKDSDIVIVGGGLNGPALALALAQTGHSVTIIDALSVETRGDIEFDGRSYALALTSQRLLEAVGLWPALAPNAQPILEIKVTDGRLGTGPSPFFMHFDNAEIEEGPMGFTIEDRHLRHAVLSALSTSDGITHLSGRTVLDQEISGQTVGVTLDNGQTVVARVLIGADGRSSSTAQRANITRTAWSYAQTALVCAIAHEKPHNGIANQFFMPGGPLAILPLTENRSSIVWSENDDIARPIQAMDDAQFLEILRPRFGDFLGEISLASARYAYPLGLSLANSFVADRVALVGDAAHGLHPIAGQGLNAGLRDVAALAETITLAARRGEDIGAPDVLARYQQWRRFDTASLALATDAFNSLFSNDNPILRAGRDLGMGLVNALPNLRRGFIREAAGLTGDLPRLLKGHPI